MKNNTCINSTNKPQSLEIIFNVKRSSQKKKKKICTLYQIQMYMTNLPIICLIKLNIELNED